MTDKGHLKKYDLEMGRDIAISAQGLALPYRYFAPKNDKDDMPLVLFLHGMGERGRDNSKQLLGATGAFIWSDFGDCHILAPQCPDELSWVHPGVPELLISLVDDYRKSHNVDENRLYVTGLSMGGIGTWNLIAKNPGKFAAAMPICGAATVESASAVDQTPIWAFHAGDDPVVPVAGELRSRISTALPTLFGTRLAVAAARAAGSMNVKYTEYAPGVIPEKWGHAHASWEEAYRDESAREWLLKQDKRDQYGYRCVTPGVWEILDYELDSFYVVEGKDRALVIDTGDGRADIAPLIEKLTLLPCDLALTHGHGDHSWHAHEFARIYLDRRDEPMLNENRFEGQPSCDNAEKIYIEDGSRIDLGGVEIDVIALPGHTDGSVLFVDKKRKCVFAGDAIGSGCAVWMQLPTASTLSEYKKSIKTALDKLETVYRVDSGWAFLGGHDRQRFMSKGCGYNPPSLDSMRDMMTLCDKLIAGEITGEPDPSSEWFGESFDARWGAAEMVYKKSILK